MFLCCLYWLRTQSIYSAMPTLYPYAIEAFGSRHILYIRYKYVLTYFWIIYAHIFYWAGRTYVQYCVGKLPNVN